MSTPPALISPVTGPAVSAFRAVVGFLFACHGAASLFGVLGGAHGGGTVPVGQWPGWFAAVIQLVGGGLVLLGLGTRAAAVLCSGSMAYAYFVVHQPQALIPMENGGEASALFCWAFLLVAILGAGPWSLDAIIRRLRGRSAERPAAKVAPVPANSAR